MAVELAGEGESAVGGLGEGVAVVPPPALPDGPLPQDLGRLGAREEADGQE